MSESFREAIERWRAIDKPLTDCKKILGGQSWCDSMRTCLACKEKLIDAVVVAHEQELSDAATVGARTCRNTSKVTDEYGKARFVCSECGAWIDSRMLWNPNYINGESAWVKDCKLNFCPNCGRRIEVDE